MKIELHNADCADALPLLDDACIDALVTDPPAGIGFMGKDWDGDKGGRDQWITWLAEIMREALRVLKPGGHALVWALPRTSHWTATALENAGFEIRDVGLHLFGTGFPKSLDVSKAIDKGAGAEREVVAVRGTKAAGLTDLGYTTRIPDVITAPATDDARQWAGWGTALKPAAEHWILARKPLVGTVAANVLEHGTGALNIDACRIACDPRPKMVRTETVVAATAMSGTSTGATSSGEMTSLGRWPAHVTLDEDAAAALDAQSGVQKSGVAVQRNRDGEVHNAVYGAFRKPAGADAGYGDTGGASRFFYVAKPSKAERGDGNTHPTVKPVALMRWLARLITPPGGLVLDPFAGSGTTALACRAEGFSFVGFERERAYFDIAQKRLRDAGA